MSIMTFSKKNGKDHEYVVQNPFSTHKDSDGNKHIDVKSPVEKREDDEVTIKLGRPGRGSK